MSDPMAHDARMNTTASSPRQQLGLGLGQGQPHGRRTRRPCSRERALWWFEQMRRAIGDGTPGIVGQARTRTHAAG